MSRFRFTQLSLTRLQIVAVFIILALSLISIWHNAFKYDYPVGYAGMYAQMANQIADENFKLPMEIQFYGSGGVPAAFPPLGMYLLALDLRMFGSPWAYIRFVPIILSTFALIPLFLFVRRLTSSNMTGLITILLASSSPYLYSTHTTAAGVVRGLAYFFGLFFFYYFLRATQNPSKKETFIAGILLSLTILTHLSYAFFFVLWSLIWMIVNPKREIWLRSIWIGSIAALFSLPWALLIISRHGWQVFFNALGSHGTLSIFGIFGDFTALFNIISISLSEIVKQRVLTIMAILGFVHIVRKKHWFFILATILTSLFSLESRRFMILLGCIFAALVVTTITVWLLKFIKDKGRLQYILIPCIIGSLIIGGIYLNGMQSILVQTPSLSASLLESAKYLRTNSNVKSSYIILADHNEAEWFPFLAQRVELFGFWGGEWNGSRSSLSDEFFMSMECGRNGDIECLEKTFQDVNHPPQYLIVMKRRYPKFINALSAQQNWKLVFKNSGYQIWRQQ